MHQIEETDLIKFLGKSKSEKAKEYIKKIKEGGLMNGLILTDDEREVKLAQDKIKDLDTLIKNINYKKDSNINYFINEGTIYFKAKDIANI